jgi:cytochrome c biogenesis protein CcdA
VSRPEPNVASPVAEPRASSRPAFLAGLTGGLIAATCCIGPAVAIATGAGAGSFLLSMGRYRPILFAIGAVVAFAVARLLLRRQRDSCSTKREYRTLRSRWLDVAMLAFAVTYAVGRFVVPRLIERL